mmetsp:Transcript_4387/g.17631  ORF Transcript_4387/g.17631 Transcript_4387/m.17631 type:complete len:201 (-) Transcript_4387:1137-1739(-)
MRLSFSLPVSYHVRLGRERISSWCVSMFCVRVASCSALRSAASSPSSLRMPSMSASIPSTAALADAMASGAIWRARRLPPERLDTCLSSARSASVAMVIALPDAPARAVRPMRCVYVVSVCGHSKLMTALTPMMSSPRAATSEHTRIAASPTRKASSDSRRPACVMLPCSSAARMPASPRMIFSLWHATFVFANTMVCER